MRKNRLFQKVFVLVSHVEKSFSIDVSGILFERGEKFIQMKIIFFTDLRVDNANFIIIFIKIVTRVREGSIPKVTS